MQLHMPWLHICISSLNFIKSVFGTKMTAFTGTFKWYQNYAFWMRNKNVTIKNIPYTEQASVQRG